jgi:LysM repeat protein
MITSTDYEATQKSRAEKARASHTASVFPQLDKSTGFSIFLAYVPVLICFLAVGLLLWHFESRTERELESIRSSLYSIAMVTIRMETNIGELQRITVESTVSKTLLESRLDRLSAQVTTLHLDLNSPPTRPAPKTSGEKTSALDQLSLYYEVEDGDTLAKIARKYGVTVGHLIVTNNLTDKDRIYPGQRILITMGDQIKASSVRR